MEETYCGKSCETCSQREAMNCLGCAQGPGKAISGTCSLAICCRQRGHEKCGTCTDRYGCNMLYNRGKMPEQRRKHEEAVKVMQERLQRSGRLLGKWLWILFWLVVPMNVADLMTDIDVPLLPLIGGILSAVCVMAYGAILLRLSVEDDHYRNAGIFTLITGACNAVSVWTNANSFAGWSLLLTILMAICSVFAIYNELTAHSFALVDVDDDLSDKWMALRKWYVINYLATLGNVFVMMISLLLSTLLLFATSIGAIIISVFKLVYLFRTAKAFRDQY